MKTVYILFSFLISCSSISQITQGFTVISQENIAKSQATNFALEDGEKRSKRKQLNIFNISLSDSVFVHTSGDYKKKKEEQKMLSQVYKITNITTTKNKTAIDLYLITVQSGLTGKTYEYFIQYHPKQMRICQIFSMKGTKKTGYKYDGIQYNKLKFSKLTPYKIKKKN